MATKKSSSAAKKKAAPKKQAAKKKSTSVKNQSVIDESAALYTNDASVQASLQAETTNSIDTPQKSESGNGIYLFLVLAGVAAIGYLGYAKYTGKKAEPSATTTTPTPQTQEQVKPEVKVEKVEEVPPVSVTQKFAVDKIEAGKKWEEANSYCEKMGAVLPSKQEFAEILKDAPSELKTGDIFWTKSYANDKKGFGFNLKSGKALSLPKTEKHKVVCKN